MIWIICAALVLGILGIFLYVVKLDMDEDFRSYDNEEETTELEHKLMRKALERGGTK